MTSGSPRLTVLGLAVMCALALTACTAASPGPTESPRSAGTASDSGILPGYQRVTKDEFSPLIITVLAPEPIPLKGSDNTFYVVYDLSVFNDAPRDATMTKIDTLAGNENGAVIGSLDEKQIAANTLLTGDYSAAAAGSTVIPAGRTVIVSFRDVYPTRKAVPATFTHRISATFAPPKPGQATIASKYPGQVAQIGDAVTVSSQSPIVVGPPLAGAGWFASNGLESGALNNHSNVILPVGGRVNAAEQFAIDFIRIDPTADPATASTHGDPARNTSYLAFDQPIIAVANATVVTVISDQPDATPQLAPDGIPSLSQDFDPPLDLYTGNVVILDLGKGIYALYAHMKQGSAIVKIGDTVKKGQEIGRVGNSGNSSEVHLHFQLQRGSLPLTADNVPWVIDSFTADGTFTATGRVKTPTPGPRTNEIPVGNSISTFPAPRH